MVVVGSLVQLTLAFLFAPFLAGVIKRAKAFLQGRTGPGVLQVYRDIAKFLGKEAVVSTYGSAVSLYAPWVIVIAMGTAALFIPLITGAPLQRPGDLFIAIYLFALARLATGLLGLDGATNFGGMGTGREMAVSALTEPVMLVGLLAAAMPAGTTGLTGILTHLATVGWGSSGLAPLLAVAALGVVLVAETGRIPVDNPDTHLELTMMHEGMILDVSGWHLALITWANTVKQLLLCSILANLILPWQPFWLDASLAATSTVNAPAGTSALPLAMWLVATLLFAAKVLVIGLVLAGVETANAKMRYFKLPYLLGSALLLGVLGVLFGLWGL